MSLSATIQERQRAFGRNSVASQDHLLRQGILKLLAIKDSDLPAQREVGGPVTLSVSTRETPQVTYPSGTWRARDRGWAYA